MDTDTNKKNRAKGMKGYIEDEDSLMNIRGKTFNLICNKKIQIEITIYYFLYSKSASKTLITEGNIN